MEPMFDLTVAVFHHFMLKCLHMHHAQGSQRIVSLTFVLTIMVSLVSIWSFILYPLYSLAIYIFSLLRLLLPFSFICCSISAGQCVDTDNGILDDEGKGCIGYNVYPFSCGKHDDDDFVAREMCCVCGGGTDVHSGKVLYWNEWTIDRNLNIYF